MKQRPGDQDLPTINDNACIQDMVIADIERRKAIGIQSYGTVLQAFNGRDALQDLYEELLDAAMYVKQAMEERKSGVHVQRVQDEFPAHVFSGRVGSQSCNCD